MSRRPLRKHGPNEYEELSNGIIQLWLTDRKGARKEAILLDRPDLPHVLQHRWSLSLRAGRKYVMTQLTARTGKERRPLYLHRFLMNPDEGLEVDHIDGNSLNNCRQNLRIVTRAEQSQNTSARGKSGFRNVSQKKNGKWRVLVGCQGRRVYKTVASLAEAVEQAAVLRNELFTHNNEEREGHLSDLPFVPFIQD